MGRNNSSVCLKRFYLLIAALIVTKIGPAAAAAPDIDRILDYWFDSRRICGKGLHAADDENCFVCIPKAMNETAYPDELDRMYESGELDECYETPKCNIDPSGILAYGVTSIGGRTKSGEGYPAYECTADGWKELEGIGGSVTCKDIHAWNGTYINCCNPRQDEAYRWLCDSYDEAYCDSGYYGTWSGHNSDCTACPLGPLDANGNRVVISSSKVNGNSATDCYIGGSYTFADASGKFIYTKACYWKN